MTYLLLCVVCSVAVSVLFKWARPKGLQAAQAVAVNYLLAIAATLVLLRPALDAATIVALPWAVLLLLGVMLPTIFVVMAHAVHRAGMVRADAAQRLSLILPLLAAATLLGESISGLKAMGLALALLAVVALIWRSGGVSTAHARPAAWWQRSGLLLLLVWLGYGVCDILFKQVAKTGAQFALVLLVAFGLAAALMWGYLLLNKTRFDRFSCGCGVVLGLLNFANIYFYIKAHQAFAAAPSVVFAGVNIGVLALALLVGVLVWGERLNKINVLGLLLAAAAVACLYATMI